MILCVLDVNIWFSIFINGNYDWLLKAVEEEKLKIISCVELENEMIQVFHYPKSKKWIGNSSDEYVFIYKEITNQISVKHSFKGCRDPKDNYIIDLFQQSKADFLVTGDKDILALKQFSDSAISFSTFKKILREI